MKSFLIRFAASFVFLIILVSWYMIPDSFFVNYSEASPKVVLDDKKEKEIEEKEETKDEKKEILKQENIKETSLKDESKNSEDDSVKNSVKYRVPFIVQAPHAQWNELAYQDACEEASLIMADAWIENKWHLSKKDTEEQMEKMFKKEKEIFAGAIDTSIEDTSKFFKEYFGHDSVIVKNVTMEGMYKILSEGNIIIAPTNGKWLNNPNFTNGGPDRHMLVVVGYDKDNNEFVTNDPGTRNGRGYKYKDSTLFNAIRNYETGNKEAIKGVYKDVMVVKK